MIDRDNCRHGNTTCDDCLTERWTLSSADGYERGLLFAVEFLRGQAGEAFSNERDDEARLLRHHSKRLESELDNAREKAMQIRIDQGIIKVSR